MQKLVYRGPRGLAHGVAFKSCLRNSEKDTIHVSVWWFFVVKMSHAEAGISGSPWACPWGSFQILSPQFKEHHAQAWCFFVLGLRPTGSRGFGCDRCQWQMKGAAKGEETGSVPTDQREGEQTTMFRGGPSQVQILSPQFNKKDTFLGVFFCCV